MTGSSARLKRSGEFYDEERKELEPLGQEILPQAPPQEMPDAPVGEAVQTKPLLKQLGSKYLSIADLVKEFFDGKKQSV